MQTQICVALLLFSSALAETAPVPAPVPTPIPAPVPAGMEMMCFTDNPDECVAVPISTTDSTDGNDYAWSSLDRLEIYEVCIAQGRDDCDIFRAPLKGTNDVGTGAKMIK